VFYCRSELRPLLKLSEFGWHMLEHMGDYNRTTWEPALSARRFECGSPNMLGTMALEASLSLLEEVGMETVGKAIAERILWLEEGLSAIPGVRLHTPKNPEKRAGILSFSLDGIANAHVFEHLKQEQVVCVQRGPGIRFSPHFYTESRVIEETLAIVRTLSAR
jgi:selenocysteine lyase/cysteine desulfurase